jgi:hypothetical protein
VKEMNRLKLERVLKALVPVALPIMWVAAWLTGVWYLDTITSLEVVIGVSAFVAVVMVLAAYVLEW